MKYAFVSLGKEFKDDGAIKLFDSISRKAHSCKMFFYCNELGRIDEILEYDPDILVFETPLDRGKSQLIKALANYLTIVPISPKQIIMIPKPERELQEVCIEQFNGPELFSFNSAVGEKPRKIIYNRSK